MSEIGAVAHHEAGHAVCARALGLRVLRASAGADPCVITKSAVNFETTVGKAAEVCARLCIVDLAGGAAELQHLWREAGDEVEVAASDFAADEANAHQSALLCVALRRGPQFDGRAEAGELVGRMRTKAHALVRANWQAVRLVAAALETGVLSESQIDALIQEGSSSGAEVEPPDETAPPRALREGAPAAVVCNQGVET